MHTPRLIMLFFTICLCAGLQGACDPPAECQGSNVSYIKCIRPTLTANCSGGGCHGGDNPEWGLQLETHGKIYDAIVPHINTADPQKSKLLNQLLPNPTSGDRMPIDQRPFLSDSQIKMIETWIAEGAKNDDPDYKGGEVKPEKPEIPADVQDVSYKDDIVPILTKSCAFAGCHDDKSKAGALDLKSAYANTINKKSINQAYDLILPGKPLESLMLIKLLEKRPVKAGSRMPIGTPLSVKETAQFYVWIEEGAKEN